MKENNLWLKVSVAANLLLLVVAIFTTAHFFTVNTKKPTEAGEHADSFNTTEQGIQSDIENQIIPLIPENRSISYEYWRPRNILSLENLVSKTEQLITLRNKLLEEFGQSAVNDPAFENLFMTQLLELRFLPQEKQLLAEQIVIKSLKQELQQNNLNASKLRLNYDKLEPELKSILSESELYELRLRSSRLALELVSLGFNYNEAEFRSVFEAFNQETSSVGNLQSLYPMIGSRSTGSGTLDSVETVLGKERAEEFKKFLDPRYRALTSLATLANISDEEITEAYNVVSDASEKMNEIIRSGPVLSALDRRRISEILNERDNQLTLVLGEKNTGLVKPLLGIGEPSSTTLVPMRPNNQRQPLIKEYQ